MYLDVIAPRGDVRSAVRGRVLVNAIRTDLDSTVGVWIFLCEDSTLWNVLDFG